MGKLVFIGIGISSEKALSLEAVEEIKGSDFVYIDSYTSYMPDFDLGKVKEMTGKTVIEVRREEIEKEEPVIIEKALENNVAFLVPGDPFISTTHFNLLIDAEDRGIKTKVIHGVSILSAAISISGLHNYKFGASATVPLEYENYDPKSFYYVLKDNLERRLHTLFYLDVDAERKRYLTVNEAVERLLSIEKKEQKNVFSEKTVVMGLARVGTRSEIIRVGEAGKIRDIDFGGAPHMLIVPGALHFSEERVMRRYLV